MSVLRPTTSMLRASARSGAAPSSHFLISSNCVSTQTFGSSTRRTFADPLHTPVGSSKQSDIGVGGLGASAPSDKYVNPYKGGASALDKAAELFFFTEILRGAYFLECPIQLIPSCAYWDLKSLGQCRHVDCRRTNLPPTIHYYVGFFRLRLGPIS